MDRWPELFEALRHGLARWRELTEAIRAGIPGIGDLVQLAFDSTFSSSRPRIRE